MNNQRVPGFGCDPCLCPKKFLLFVAIRIVPEKIKSCFTDSDNFILSKFVREILYIPGRVFIRLVRMNPDRTGEGRQRSATWPVLLKDIQHAFVVSWIVPNQ